MRIGAVTEPHTRLRQRPMNVNGIQSHTHNPYASLFIPSEPEPELLRTKTFEKSGKNRPPPNTNEYPVRVTDEFIIVAYT